MAQTAELACVYASLILADDNSDITADKLSSIVNAAGVEVESIWFSLFAKALEGKNIKDLLFNIGAPGSGAPAGAAAAGAPAAGAAAGGAAKEEKKEEVKEESEDEDMGFGLFD